MKHCHFSHFLYRAFHSPGFRLSTGLGFIVAVCQIVQMFSPVDTGFSYPSSLYEMWLGGEWASYASALVFLLLSLFATLPFSSSLAEDKKSGYLIQLLIRGKRLSVFFRYAVSTFLSGFVAAVLPFLENLFLNAAIYPALMPQPSTYTFSPSLRGFMVKIFTVSRFYTVCCMCCSSAFSLALWPVSDCHYAFSSNRPLWFICWYLRHIFGFIISPCSWDGIL